MKKSTFQLSVFAGILGLLFLSPNKLSAQYNDGSIAVTHSIEPSVVSAGSTVTVTCTLNKGYMGGLSRFDEFMPHGFTAAQGQAVGSSFYVTDTIVHFAWSHIPFDTAITMTYNLTVPSDASGSYTLNAQFIYVTSSGAESIYFKPYTINVQAAAPAPVAKNVPLQKPTPVHAVVATPVKDTTNNMPVVNNTPAQPNVAAKTPPTPAPKNTPPATVSNHPAPAKVTASPSSAVPAASVARSVPMTTSATAKSLFYRVQIMASSQRLDADSVIINGVRDKLYITTTNGISRYFIGQFTDLTSAANYRKRILNNGLPGPFVVAFKDGQKISIKQSLEIVQTN